MYQPLTLKAANMVFSFIGISFNQSPLGFYYAELPGERIEAVKLKQCVRQTMLRISKPEFIQQKEEET